MSNSSTLVVSVAMLLVVLLQAPRARTNQYFAMMMLLLAGWNVTNMISRFTAELELDPQIVFSFTSILYLYLYVMLTFFAEVFTDSPNRFIRAVGLTYLVTFTIGIIAGWIFEPPRIAPGDAQGYILIYKPLGYLTFISGMSYVVFIVWRLHRNPDPRAQALRWPGAVMLFGVFMLLIRPLALRAPDPLSFILTLPYNSMALGIAAILLGRAVLKHQLFNPLKQLNIELQRSNSQLQEANELKNQFLANISHELRTPLNAIIGYTDLIIAEVYGPLNNDQSDRLKRVKANSRHLLELINDVLDLSRIDAGALELSKSPLDCYELAEDVIRALNPLATEKGLELRLLPPPRPISLTADPQRLKQVLINLVGNAIKFTERGAINIRIFEEGANVGFAVQDSGIGIPPEHIEAIFQEFRQADGSTTRRHQGSGLGLTISKRIVTLHGGTIFVESEVGLGSTFYVHLPVQQSDPHPSPNPSVVKPL